MSRTRRVDLEALMSNPKIRATLEKVAGRKVLDHAARLAGVELKGYCSEQDAAPDPTLALLKLAVNDVFTRKDMARIKRARDWTLANAALSTVGHLRRLQLLPDARAKLLDMPRARCLLEKLLGRLEKKDQESLANVRDLGIDKLVGVLIRVLLRGPSWYKRAGLCLKSTGSGQIPDRLDLRGIEPVVRDALVKARRALAAVKDLPAETPSLAECERIAELADLLEPLGLMIGMRPGTFKQGHDRFVGREGAMAALRRKVDVLEPKSQAETGQREASRMRQSIEGSFGLRRARMMVISADGGIGKSTLIAKFVLDHALLAPTPIPFAFLDFDRAALQPRNPASLLGEIARQVALQFPAHGKRLTAFQANVEKLQASQQVLDLKDEALRIRQLIDEVLDEEKAPCFLLTLDTVELVQCDPRAQASVSDLLRMLALNAHERLVVVAAGRPGGADFVLQLKDYFEVEPWPLESFSWREANEMVERLAEQLMGDDWREDWTQRVVGRPSDPPIRREPLTLRLAIEIIRDAKPETRNGLVSEIGKRGEQANRNVIGRLYEIRILNHIPDNFARALAWPGLIAREVTSKLARTVLARLCGLEPDEADHGFKKLAQQGWIVEREGEVLYHRRDLRARTLSLMRAHNPERFDEVVDALIMHFAEDSKAGQVEATYYRLLKGGEDLLEKDWPVDCLRKLASAREDFQRGSSGRLVLDAANATHSFELEEMTRLPAPLLWFHVSRAGTTLRTLDDERIEPRLLHLAELRPPETKGEDDAAWQFVQIKCGRWDDLDPSALVLPSSEEDTVLFAFYTNRLSANSDVEPSFWAKRYPQLLERIGSDRVQKNWRAMAEALAVANQYDPELASLIDGTLEYWPPQQSHWCRSAEIGLRTLMLHGRRSRAAAFPIWCAFEAARMRDGVSFSELAILARPLIGDRIVPATSPLGRVLLEAVPGESGIFSGSDELNELAKALRKWADRGDSGSYEIAERYCRVREPEWIVPMAYLLHPRLPEGWVQDIDLDAVVGGAHRIVHASQRRTGPFDDLIQLLSTADRASNFDNTARQLIAKANIEERLLVRSRDRARRNKHREAKCEYPN